MAGDGTTSVTVICGALLQKCLDLLARGVHPTVISDAFAKAAQKAAEVRHPADSACEMLELMGRPSKPLTSCDNTVFKLADGSGRCNATFERHNTRSSNAESVTHIESHRNICACS